MGRQTIGVVILLGLMACAVLADESEGNFSPEFELLFKNKCAQQNRTKELEDLCQEFKMGMPTTTTMLTTVSTTSPTPSTEATSTNETPAVPNPTVSGSTTTGTTTTTMEPALPTPGENDSTSVDPPSTTREGSMSPTPGDTSTNAPASPATTEEPDTVSPRSDEVSSTITWIIVGVLLGMVVMIAGGFFIHRYAKRAGYRHSSKTNGDTGRSDNEQVLA